MTDPIAKAMFRRLREEERARIAGSYAEADRFATRMGLRIIASLGALGLLAVVSALTITIDRNTGHQLTQWFGGTVCK